jgi:hypothetical protein
VAKLPDQPIEPVSRRPRLVAKRQLTVFGRSLATSLCVAASPSTAVTE